MNGVHVPRAAGGTEGQDQVLRYCDFRDFIRHLGVDPRVDASGIVMVAAHHMFAAPLPPDWSEQIDDESSRVYFFNRLSGESLWVHPQAELYRDLIEEIRCWAPDEPVEAIFQRADAYLRQAHKQGAEVVAEWSAFDAPQGPEDQSPEAGEAAQFFFNAATGESRWTDPRESVEFDLKLRHSILCECIAAHTQTLARMAKGVSSDSSEGEDGRGHDHSVQALVQNLWESLGTLPLPARRDAALRLDASPPTSARPLHLPAGDDTVRSSVSYLTARSSASAANSSRTELPSLRGEDVAANVAAAAAAVSAAQQQDNQFLQVPQAYHQDSH